LEDKKKPKQKIEDEEEEDEEEEVDEEEEEEGDDEPMSTSSTNISKKNLLLYFPGTLNKCCQPGCEKKEQTLNQFKLCSRCKKVCYCTLECQRKAWRKHKVQCQKL